jgi:hypothetical protein
MGDGLGNVSSLYQKLVHFTNDRLLLQTDFLKSTVFTKLAWKMRNSRFIFRAVLKHISAFVKQIYILKIT